eukprot:tig00022075_g23652.t1
MSQSVLCDRSCAGGRLFNPFASSTFANATTAGETPPQVAVRYGIGYFLGSLGVDTVTVGNVTVRNQPVALATHIDAETFSATSDPISGILGLGPTSAESGADEGATILENGFLQNVLPFAEASFYLVPSPSSDPGSPQSIARTPFAHPPSPRPLKLMIKAAQMVFGGRDLNRTYYWAPIASDSYWAVPLANVTLDGRPVGGCGGPEEGVCFAVIDSGTSLLAIPEDFTELPFDCGRAGRLPNITFDLGPVPIFLSPADYVFAVPSSLGGSGECLFGFQTFVRSNTSRAPPGFVLGALFFRSYAPVFDRRLGAIGLASAPDREPAFGSPLPSPGLGAPGSAADLAPPPGGLFQPPAALQNGPSSSGAGPAAGGRPGPWALALPLLAALLALL